MNKEVRDNIKYFWVNEANAYMISQTVYQAYLNRPAWFNDYDFIQWLNYMYENAPYDDYE